MLRTGPGGQATLVTNSLNLRLDSHISVNNSSILDVTGAVQASSTQQTNIGNSSTVELRSASGFSLLSGMSFIGPNATLKLGGASPIAANDGTVGGFGATDSIDFMNLTGVTHLDFAPSTVGQGVLELLNAQNAVVGSIGLAGTFTTSNFVAASDHHGGTAIAFHA
jgi:hypothetical protein